MMTRPTDIDNYAAIAEVLNKYDEGRKQANSAITKSVERRAGIGCYGASGRPAAR